MVVSEADPTLLASAAYPAISELLHKTLQHSILGSYFISTTLVHGIVEHVFRAAMHCRQAEMLHRLFYHKAREAHEGNQSQPITQWDSASNSIFVLSVTFVVATFPRPVDNFYAHTLDRIRQLQKFRGSIPFRAG